MVKSARHDILSLALWSSLALGVLAPPPAGAQQAAAPSPSPSAARPPEGRRLPPDTATEHKLELPGRTLAVTAVAGSLPLTDPSGAVQAEIAFVAYSLAGRNPATRPVTFLVNGGPGSASAYLHLLAAGPWRLPMGDRAISPSQSTDLVPNAETWLDFTDLVFIDPVDTGYSRANASAEEKRDRYFSVEGDVGTLGAAIARWLRTNDRLSSPKFFAGESYGGFRGPLLAQAMVRDNGVALSGLVLVSPVLDFTWLSQPRHGFLEHVARLPSLAATARERQHGTSALSREALTEAERYAEGDYLADLLRGAQDDAALDRLGRRVGALTGLDPALVKRLGGRVDLGTVKRESRRPDGRLLSIYDSTVSGLDPDPSAPNATSDDPQLGAMQAVLVAASVDHLARTLRWRVPNARYELSNGSVNGAWRYGRGRTAPEAVNELKGAVATDPALRVLVAHGYTDLVTPYFASALLLRQVPAHGDATRVSLATYPGGHMFYTRDTSRAAFREDVRTLVERSLEARARHGD